MQVTMLNIKFIENTLKVSYRSRHHEEQNGTDGISEDTHQWHIAFFHKTFYKTSGLQSLL